MSDDEVDAEGRLHIRIEPSDLPCDSCGSLGPNKRWHLSGRPGVQCVKCFSDGRVSSYGYCCRACESRGHWSSRLVFDTVLNMALVLYCCM
jgi:hypothetical protein